jgi:carboxyl-terminal processing protease
VPLDSTFLSDFYVDLLNKGVFGDFVLSYVDQERKSLKKKYPLFNQFETGFQIDGSILEEFLKFSETKGILRPLGENSKIYRLIRYQLKALIARNLYDITAYFKVINQIDDGFQKALEIIGNDYYFEGINTN